MHVAITMSPYLRSLSLDHLTSTTHNGRIETPRRNTEDAQQAAGGVRSLGRGDGVSRVPVIVLLIGG